MSEFLAEAQVLIVPNTAQFAASLRAQVEAAVAKAGPITIPVVAAPVGTGTAVAAQQELAVATKVANVAAAEQAGVLSAEKAAARAAAIEQRRLATTEVASARAHAQATRGLAAETLALGGLRGATLAASAPFLIGATAAIVFAKSIKEASNANEEFNKSSVVFGQSAEQIQHFSETTATSLGISSTEALKAAGIFGNLFRSIKLSEPVSADLSQRLVRLAADLASFNNADPSRTLEALRSGLVGQARPLRVFGIFLTQARAQQQALVDTGKENIKELTNAEIVQARFNIIMRDSVLAQGDFARTSDRVANQTRILKAQLADTGEALGKLLLPALNETLKLLNDYVSTVRRGVKATQDFAHVLGALPGPAGAAGGKIEGLAKEATKLYFRFALLGPVMGAATLAEKAFGDGAEDAAPKVSVFASAIGALTDLIAALQVAGARPLKDISQQLNALNVQRLQVQTGLAGGGRGAEEANLRDQIELDKKTVALSKSGTEARRKALEELKADQDDLANLLEQDASDAKDRVQRIKDAAAKQKKAAEDAARAQADATQAFIDSFSGRQQRLQDRLTSAQLFGTAKQQIALNKLIVTADKAEINAIQERIRHLHLHGEALKLAQRTIQQLNQEIFNTRNAILQLQAERKQALVDARQSHLEAQLAIAETTASTRDDASAEKALIKFDQVQIRRILAIKRRRRLTLEEAAQLDAFRVDLAQRNQALKDLKGEQDNTSKRMKELFFSFLQTQQGFAANLLGNLIPGGATGGLVGNVSPAGQQLTLPQPGAAVQRESAIAAGRDLGFSRGQGDTTNALLRKILASLQHLNGRAGHPEARHQRATQSAFMDVIGT